MPVYEFRCPNDHRLEELCTFGIEEMPCRCGERAARIPSRFRIGSAPATGKEVRKQFRLFQEATQELDYAHVKAEVDLERPIPTPRLWGKAKERALQIINAGEAPPLAPLD